MKRKTEAVVPRIESVPIDSVYADPANVRRHPERNIDTIKASLARFGQQKPIVVDADGVVRAGNGTLAAAKALGWATIKIVRTDLRGVEATAYAIADNRTAELAEWDGTGLAETLRALRSEEDEGLFEAAGFSENELDRLCEGLGDVEIGELPDLNTSESHQITISYASDDEAALREFVGQDDDGPLSPQIGKQILGRIKDLASA